MAINIHTDKKFERVLEWLSRNSQRTKTDLIKELIWERYQWKRSGFHFGAAKDPHTLSPQKIQKTLKELDQDRDLD